MKDKIVMTEAGEVQGIWGYDPRVLVFKGIPYAKPPVGALRWRAPQLCDPWEGVRKCDQYGPISVQPQPGANPEEFWTREIHPTGTEFSMSEDCLYLNVFTPARKGDEKLPVLFYIHGGGFKGGYPYEVEFDWEHMAKKGMVCVAVTYRLGVMGFLAHPDLYDENPEEVQGNFGLMDQLAAISWVQRNIEAFGGDPSRITIAGQSAGAGSVQCLITSPRVPEGLIHGAIIESGITMNMGDGPVPMLPYSVEEAYENGRRLFALAGVNTLEEARQIPAAELMKLEDQKMGPGFHFQPVIDHVFLEESPSDAYMKGHQKKIPVIAGYNVNEAKGHFADLIVGTALFGDLHSEAGCRAYLYRFDPEIPGEDQAGSYHGSEMWFAYDSLARCWRPFRGWHYDLARQMSSYWANFVKFGDPNGVDTIGDPLPRWEASSEVARVNLEVHKTPELAKIQLGETDLKRMAYAVEKAGE